MALVWAFKRRNLHNRFLSPSMAITRPRWKWLTSFKKTSGWHCCGFWKNWANQRPKLACKRIRG